MNINEEELLIPTVEIANAKCETEIFSRRYYIVDRAQMKAKDSLQRPEDIEEFKVIKNSPHDYTCADECLVF